MSLYKSFKFYNMKVEKPSEDDLDRSEGIINWGFVYGKNDYPNTLLRTIKQSPTANACMRTRRQYVQGSGVNIDDLINIPVNKEQRFKKLHNDLSETVSKMNGIAIHVKRKPNGEIAELKKIPFEDVRLGIPDDNQEVETIKYNPRWEQRDFKNYETKTYDLYTKDVAVFQKRLKEWNSNSNNKGEKYPGEIYWDCIKNDGFPYYPFPFSDIDFKVFETDSAFRNFDFNNIKNNFLLSAIMNVYGDPQEAIYNTYTNRDNEEVKEYLGTKGELLNTEMQNSFGGDENPGTVLVSWYRNAEEKADIQAFPGNTNSDLFQETQDRLQNNISHICDVPNILANIETAGKLGGSQEKLEAIQLLNNSVNEQQELLEDAYNELIPKMGFTFQEPIEITKLNPINFIPDKIWDAVPDKAKIKYIVKNFDIEIEEEDLPQVETVLPQQEQPNVDNVEAQKVNENITNLTGKQMQNLQRIVRKYKKGETTYMQTSILLKQAFGFTDEEVEIWLNDEIEGNE